MREMLIFRFLFFFLWFLHLLQLSVGQKDDCKPSQCHVYGPSIEFPFRIKGQQPKHCGLPGFELTCKDTDTIIQLPSVGEFLVYHISYSTHSISVGKHCLAEFVFGFDAANNNSSSSSSSASSYPFHYFCNTKNYSFFSCPTHYASDSFGIYVVPCLSNALHTVVFMDPSFDLALLPESCSVMATVAVPIVPFHYAYGYQGYYSNPEKDYYGEYDGSVCIGDYRDPSWVYYASSFYPRYLQKDFSSLSLKWEVPGCNCSKVGERCRFKNKTTQELGCKLVKDVAIGGVSIALLVLIAAIGVSIKVYKSRNLANKKARQDQLKVEKFLEDYKSLKPTRHSYSEIKEMTIQYKCKLGQGGYGSVFKGELSDGNLVAVKILKLPASHGDDFINEVGTIGRIHHVNVVRLLGYCAEGYKRALIYEFMPNESLEKFIFSEDANNPLRHWKKLQDIAKGIARGIEYLHQGCDQSILHFDIKPHNILLDKSFNPKITDFGLAKFCAKGQSNVSMTAARGTMGYIAPEVFSRNFGNVSYKSDVYSFGMLLLEMLGGRKNIEASVEHSSQVYFPEWIYNRLHQGEELGLRIVAEEDAEIARRLTIVATWCIQWYPSGRPLMKTVIRMLEGEIDNLEMPPNPFVSMASGEA
ncbi:rust resistance kinase Lr10-like [Telopea speciosissima]|uniref:rust resistance kinase Lr10-like n=1 Tax=Telopea speciosissima TaxID=54955 RepID=UPI001CC76C50|nr:rust resistance kinase Lr10-like [Telopea speciosissima]